MIYAGIGARITPCNICDQMNGLARYLGIHGHTLRSGHAKGADVAFEMGAVAVGGPTEIFQIKDGAAHPDWLEHAAKFHPNWDACDYWAQSLHGRNSAVLLGADLKTPVEMVVCWTSGGAVSGGTGQALRIAKAHNIPIFNLWYPQHLVDALTFGMAAHVE